MYNQAQCSAGAALPEQAACVKVTNGVDPTGNIASHMLHWLVTVSTSWIHNFNSYETITTQSIHLSCGNQRRKEKEKNPKRWKNKTNDNKKNQYANEIYGGRKKRREFGKNNV